MDQLFPVVFVAAFIAFILLKQIKHFTENLDNTSDNSFSRYSNFSVSIQNYIRMIKSDIDSTKEKDTVRYTLKENIDEEKSLEILADFLRKLVFFETLLAKQKSSSEIESELFKVLSSLDGFLRENCEEGDERADELREVLFEEFENN